MIIFIQQDEVLPTTTNHSSKKANYTHLFFILPLVLKTIRSIRNNIFLILFITITTTTSTFYVSFVLLNYIQQHSNQSIVYIVLCTYKGLLFGHFFYFVCCVYILQWYFFIYTFVNYNCRHIVTTGIRHRCYLHIGY